jgi:hypothetical protein
VLIKPPFPRLNRGHPLAQGLGLALPFYEGSGLTANDLSGDGNTGTLSGGVSWAPGQSGSCLSFGGSNGNVVIPAGNTINWSPGVGYAQGQQISVSMWVYYSNTSQDGVLFEIEPVNAAFLLFLESGNLILRGSQSDSMCSATAPAAGWHHIVATIQNFLSGSYYTTRSIYVDGQLVATTGGGTDNVVFIADATQIDIGYGADFSAYGFSGLIDDVLVWDRVLSPAEIVLLYYDAFVMLRPRRAMLKSSAAPTFLPAWAMRNSLAFTGQPR